MTFENRTVLVTGRPGDLPVLVGSNEKARQLLGWQPQYPLAKDILSHAWAWHQQRHGNNHFYRK